MSLYQKQKNSFFVVIFLSIFFAVFLFYEGRFRINEYYHHMTHDVALHYEEKEQDYIQIGELIAKIFKASVLASSNLKGNFSSPDLKNFFQTRYEQFEQLRLKQNGISRVRFYAVDGEIVFDSEVIVLNENTSAKVGFNPLLQRVLQTQERFFGYQVMCNFQGFDYIQPIKEKEHLLGYIEIMVPFDVLVNEMDTVLPTQSLIIYNQKELEAFSADKGFVPISVKSSLLISQVEKESFPLQALQPLLKGDNVIEIMQKKGLSRVILDNLHAYFITILPLFSFNQTHIGYLVSIQHETNYWMIITVQIIKYMIFLLVIWTLYFVYRKHLNSELLMEQYKNIVDLTTIVSKTDIHGKITYVNEAFEKLSGYEAKELLGKPHNIVRAPEMPRSLFKELWKTIQKGEIWQGKITNLRKEGGRYTVQATIVPLKNAQGKIIEYMALRYDITELEAYRHILEDRLLKTDDDLQKHISLITQYQKAIEQASSFCRYDASGMITYVNETMCRISQCSEEELINHNVVALNLITPEKFQTILDEVNSGQTWKGVIECNHKKNVMCYLDATFSPIVEGNTIKEIMCISHDVTPIYNLYQEIEDTQKEVVFTMGAIGESRSKETGNHVKRVAEYSKRLALLYGLSSEEAELLKQASPMHDIGKVAIPDAILQKPGKLTEEEWKVMQTHSQLGYEMLAHSSRTILQAAATVAYEHHEKWNGKGYPRGLKEEAIHVYGRITAIADVFDALGSDRCYKKAWDDEAILELFRKERGEHFDPQLVDLFLNHIALFYDIRARFQ